MVLNRHAHARSPEASGKDQQDGRMEVTVEPRTASSPEPFAGEDHFCQDSLY